jgi:Predicted membrane protein
MNALKTLDRPFTRFLISGGINTALTYLIYLALVPFMAYTLAYSASYVAGIVIAYVINTRFVFQARMQARSALLYPLVYVAQYAAGVVLLALLVEALGVDERIAPAAVIVLTIPLTFILSRVIIRGGLRA